LHSTLDEPIQVLRNIDYRSLTIFFQGITYEITASYLKQQTYYFEMAVQYRLDQGMPANLSTNIDWVN
jgi:hypothetical protein